MGQIVPGLQHLQPPIIIYQAIGKCLLQGFSGGTDGKIQNLQLLDQNVLQNLPGDIKGQAEIQHRTFQNKICVGICRLALL